ncbi:MAG: CvpA family protein [Urechidicola sp.]|nr:CvpA family protein [Urechidicola sp.]
MNTFDIVIAALLLFGFIRGFSKGLFMELASLIALIAGIYGAIHFSYLAEGLLVNNVSWDEEYIAIAAFAITFIIIVLAIALVGRLFTKIADFAALGILNKILGGAFGALKYGLILSIIFIVFDKLNKNIPFVSEEKTEDSLLFTPVRDLAPLLFSDFLTVEDIELDDLQKGKETQDEAI